MCFFYTNMYMLTLLFLIQDVTSQPWWEWSLLCAAAWNPTSTRRLLMEVGAGWWPWPSSLWRFSPTASSRSSASSCRTSPTISERPTAGCRGSCPSASSSCPSQVSCPCRDEWVIRKMAVKDLFQEQMTETSAERKKIRKAQCYRNQF